MDKSTNLVEINDIFDYPDSLLVDENQRAKR
jgi:hypothetical protein